MFNKIAFFNVMVSTDSKIQLEWAIIEEVI